MPLATIFPPVPQTVWTAGDPALEIAGNDSPELNVRGPHITLDAGMFGVEVALSIRGELPNQDEPAARVQITVESGQQVITETQLRSGQILQAFGGMYGGARLTLILDRRMRDVEIRVAGLGKHALTFHQLKLIPRPGQLWFVRQLTHEPTEWEHRSDLSSVCLAPTEVRGPSIELPPGDYRVGIKFTPPPGVNAGQIAEIAAVSEQGVIVPSQAVVAEQVLANFGIPDSKLRFRLDRMHTGVELPIRMLAPGAAVQWVRLATADESIWQHYYNMGGLASALGPPASGFVPCFSGLSGEEGYVRHFEGGSIYWTIDHGPCEVHGAILREYARENGPAGRFGFPTGRPRIEPPGAEAGRMIQPFEGGRIEGSR